MLRMEYTAETHSTGGPGLFIFGRAEESGERLLTEYRGKVQLIYLDPPFGTGDAFEISRGPKGKKIKVPAYSDKMSDDAYMEMMKNVLELCRELMTSDGTLYLHVDYRMAAYLRVLLDEVFGKKNFVNEIIWAYRSGGRATKHFSRKHDNILVYRKGRSNYFNIEAVGIPRGPERRNHMKRHIDDTGRIYYSIRSGGKLYKYYEDSLIYPSDVWTDIEHLQQRDPERTGYSTQKPEALLRRIILSSSKEGDIVADLFSGSGTTAAAAQKLGRRWIAVDPSPAALMTLRKRLLDNNSDASLLKTAAGMDIEYLQTPASGKKPSITVQRTRTGCTVTPDDDSLAYMAAGRLEEGRFITETYDTSPLPGKKLTIASGRHAILVSDLCGNLSVWGNLG